MKLHVSRAEREKRVFIMREGKINFSYLKATYFIILLLYLIVFIESNLSNWGRFTKCLFRKKKSDSFIYNFIQFYLDKIFKLVNKVPLLLAYYIRIRQDSASSGHDISKQPFRRKCIYIYTYIKTLLFLPSDGYSSSFFFIMSPLEKHFYVIYTLCIFDSVEKLSSREKKRFVWKKEKEGGKKGKEGKASLPSVEYFPFSFLYLERGETSYNCSSRNVHLLFHKFSWISSVRR